jgi:predicted transposase/invertase (TIGR01784 family)
MSEEKAFKPIEELTLMDDYMFAAVMRDTRHLKPLLEYILNIRIAKIELVEPQKTAKEGYSSKGIRLDLYVEDEFGTIYNVEVQTTDKRNLPRRMRYYQSVIDIHVLHPGDDYRNLRKSFVIFICNYDPFGRNRYIYTFETVCREVPGLSLGDDAYKIVLNTSGTEGEISIELKEVILYLGSGKVTGAYSRELDEAVNAVKTNEDRRLEYMTMMIHDMEIREEARAEERAELLLALVKDGYLPASEAARRLNMTEREFLRLSGQYVAH